LRLSFSGWQKFGAITFSIQNSRFFLLGCANYFLKFFSDLNRWMNVLQSNE